MTGTEKKKEAEQLLASVDRSPLCCDLQELMPVHIERVCGHEQDLLRDILVSEYHYLGHRKMVGRHLKYLAFSGKRVIAALGWRAAALWLEARDKVHSVQRRHCLHQGAGGFGYQAGDGETEDTAMPYCHRHSRYDFGVVIATHGSRIRIDFKETALRIDLFRILAIQICESLDSANGN